MVDLTTRRHLHEVDAPARGVHLLAPERVRRARRQAEAAVHAVVEQLLRRRVVVVEGTGHSVHHPGVEAAGAEAVVGIEGALDRAQHRHRRRRRAPARRRCAPGGRARSTEVPPAALTSVWTSATAPAGTVTVATPVPSPAVAAAAGSEASSSDGSREGRTPMRSTAASGSPG